MIGKSRNTEIATSEYREEQVKPSIYTMLVVVAVVAAPLGWLNLKIGAEGSKIADTTRYREVVDVVNQDVNTVRLMLDNAHVDENALKGALAPAVTLISPKIMPTNMDEATMQKSTTFKIEMNGIYWSKHDPIVTINNENYHVGDMIQGHRILEIRKTEVLFEDPMGEKVMKYFYEYLD